MAGFHSGVFGEKFNCDRCAGNESLRDVWGCERKTRMSKATFEEEEAEDGKLYHYKYWNCPWHFVSMSVIRLMKMYSYYKTFPNAVMPSIKDVSNKFLSAIQYYEMKLAENIKAKNNA